LNSVPGASLACVRLRAFRSNQRDYFIFSYSFYDRKTSTDSTFLSDIDPSPGMRVASAS
jgi:hypothetical protein